MLVTCFYTKALSKMSLNSLSALSFPPSADHVTESIESANQINTIKTKSRKTTVSEQGLVKNAVSEGKNKSENKRR